MRILVVEDDSRIANFVAKGLREQAYAVDVTANGEDALYQASINAYDLTILDVMIPAPDGFEVCRRLRESGLRLPILMLTARDTTDDRIVGREEISEHVWDETFDPFTNTIEVYVNRLRRKIDEHAVKPLIHTRRGARHMLGAAKASNSAMAQNAMPDGAKTRSSAMKSAAEPRAAGKKHA